MILLLVVVLVFAILRFANLFAILFAGMFVWSLENPGGFLLVLGTLAILFGYAWGLLAIGAGFLLWRRR